MFSVIVAIELLDTGDPGVGALMAAVGVGAVLGSLGASLLVGTGRLGAWFAVGVGLWGLPIALVGVFPQEIAALGLLAFVGVGNALIDAWLAQQGRSAASFNPVERLCYIGTRGMGALEFHPALYGGAFR